MSGRKMRGTRRCLALIAPFALSATGGAPSLEQDRAADARARADRGELLEAIADLQAASRPAPAELVTLAELEQRAGRYDASAAVLDEVVASDPSNARAQMLRAYADWYAGRLVAARARLEALAGRGSEPAVAQAARREITKLDDQIAPLLPIREARRRLSRWFAVAATVTGAGALLLTAVAMRAATRARA